MKPRIACVITVWLSLVVALTPLVVAQTSSQTASALPRLVRFGGTVKDLNGNPLTGVVGITFALYSEQSGGATLWLETQNVTADNTGHYTALLGSTKPDGLPAELFTSEQARWVGVQVSGQPEQPRVLLVSAPYALKAGDAETIGGLPPSAFVLAAPPTVGTSVSEGATSSPPSSSSSSVSPATSSDVTTTGGTASTIPMYTTATNIQNSILTQTGTTSVNVVGKLNLPSTAAATKTAGADSRILEFVASSFSSTSSAAVNQNFQWRAEPAANDTASPSGTLNLLYGLGTAVPTETGLELSSKGIFTFAAGQTFPGHGRGHAHRDHHRLGQRIVRRRNDRNVEPESAGRGHHQRDAGRLDDYSEQQHGRRTDHSRSHDSGQYVYDRAEAVRDESDPAIQRHHLDLRRPNRYRNHHRSHRRHRRSPAAEPPARSRSTSTQQRFRSCHRPTPLQVPSP